MRIKERDMSRTVFKSHEEGEFTDKPFWPDECFAKV